MLINTMLYKKKPVVISAIQWTGENELQIMNFVGRELHVSKPPRIAQLNLDLPPEAFNVVIPTLEGDMIANRFDWIIKGIKGEFYPCKPDIFEQTYEKVDG